MIRTRAFIVALALAFAAPHPSGAAPSAEERARSIALAGLTFKEARDEALKQVIGGVVVKMELLIKEDIARYEVSMLVGDNTRVVGLDAGTGKPLTSVDTRRRKDAGLISELFKDPNIGLLQAAELAEKEIPGGKVFSVEAITRGNQLQFEVWLVQSEKLNRVRLDAEGTLVEAGINKPLEKKPS